MIRTFHERYKIACKDIQEYHTEHDVSFSYCAEWIARLQLRNDIIKIASNKQLEQIADLTEERDRLLHEEIAVGDGHTICLDELRRRLDAANSLLDERAEKIADLRESRNRLREDNGNLRRNRDSLRTENGDLATNLTRCHNANVEKDIEITRLSKLPCDCESEDKLKLKRIIAEAHELFHSW